MHQGLHKQLESTKFSGPTADQKRWASQLRHRPRLPAYSYVNLCGSGISTGFQSSTLGGFFFKTRRETHTEHDEDAARRLWQRQVTK